jgi:hypothetical protein
MLQGDSAVDAGDRRQVDSSDRPAAHQVLLEL